MSSTTTLFVISSGRSGTAYLCDLWKLAEQHQGPPTEGCDGVVVAAKHEPLPVCCGLPMERWNEGYSKAMSTLVEVKRGKIQEELAHAGSDENLAGRRLIYVETNAQFIKGFGWEWMKSTPAAQHGQVGVIVLTRDKDAVTQSFLSNCEAPGFDSFANVWNIRPHCARSYSERGAQLPSSSSASSLSSSSSSSFSSSSCAFSSSRSTLPRDEEIDVVDVDDESAEDEGEPEEQSEGHEFEGQSTPEAAVRWQLDEIEARTHVFKQRYPAVPMFRVDLSELNEPEKVLEMFAFFKVSHRVTPEILAQVVNRPVNTAAERCHTRSWSNEDLSVLRPAPELPTDPQEQAKLVDAVVDYILQQQGDAVLRHAAKRRAILETGSMSIMIAAKSIIDELYLPICSEVLGGRHFSFSDLRWNVMCRLVQRLDPTDAMFRFVTEITTCRFRLDGLNGEFERQWLARHITHEEEAVGVEAPEQLHCPLDDQQFVVAITGATGQLGQCLLPAVLQDMLVRVQRLEIRLLVLPNSLKKAQALIADVEDALISTSSTAVTITATTDVRAAFSGAHLALLLASAPRLEHYDRLHLAPQQVDIYSHHGHELAHVASPSCQIVVVANPVLTVARILLRAAPSLGGRVTALTALDETRAASCILKHAAQVFLHKPEASWTRVAGLRAIGNHSESVFIDCSAAVLMPPVESDRPTPVRVVDALGEAFLLHDLQEHVRDRGRDIVNGLGRTALVSTVQAIIRHVHLVLNIEHHFRGVRPLFSTGMQLPHWDSRIHVDVPCCLDFASLPCRFAESSHRVVPDLRALRRALAWSPQAGRALSACVDELAVDWRMCGFHDEPPDDELVLGAVLLQRLATARRMLGSATRIVVFAGAGMSTSSGISDITSFEQAFPALHKRGVHSIFQVSNHRHFCEEPRSAWGFWAQRARDYASAEPDSSYGELLRLCTRSRATDFFVCTSNIDRLFTKAGFPEDRLYEVHGSLFDLQCTNEQCTEQPYRLPIDCPFFSVENLPVDAHWMCADSSAVPQCTGCSQPLRIATELAVDGHYRKDLVLPQRKRFKSFLRHIGPEENVVVLEIGCGTAMSKLRDTANNFARLRRLRQRSGVVKGHTSHFRINIHQSSFATKTSDDISLPLPAAQALSQLLSNESD